MNAGATIETVQCHGAWKSANTARKYWARNMCEKKNVSSSISRSIAEESANAEITHPSFLPSHSRNTTSHHNSLPSHSQNTSTHQISVPNPQDSNNCQSAPSTSDQPVITPSQVSHYIAEEIDDCFPEEESNLQTNEEVQQVRVHSQELVRHGDKTFHFNNCSSFTINIT